MYKYISSNSRIGCILILAVFSLVISWYMYTYVNRPKYVTKFRTEIIIPYSDPLVYECCTPLNISVRNNLFFLKTHKTGTTTLKNIILRFAKKHNLSIMWPDPNLYYIPLSTEILKKEHITADNKYNIMAFHTQFSPELKSYQYPGSLLISILRHPATLFQSWYNYFKMEEKIGMTIEEFLKAPGTPSNWGQRLNDKTAYRGYNQLSVDLGFDPQNADNLTAIQEFIEYIDDEFDFMMITEYMEASLVLLANLMGWPLEYVTSLPLNARDPHNNTYVLTEEDKILLMELNNVDTLLYNHFLQKFLECIRQFGEAELNNRIETLREMNTKLYEKCIRTELTERSHNTTMYVLKNYDKDCRVAVKLYH